METSDVLLLGIVLFVGWKVMEGSSRRFYVSRYPGRRRW